MLKTVEGAGLVFDHLTKKLRITDNLKEGKLLRMRSKS